jgi:hypothetical protein
LATGEGAWSGLDPSASGPRVSRNYHADAVRAALLLTLMVVAVLSAGACGGGGTDAGRPTVSPPDPRRTPSPTASPTPGERALQPGPPLTPDAILRHIAGRRIKAAGRTIRVDAATVTCGGLGRPSRRRRDELAWTRFRCIQPTFPAGAIVGPDLIFVVHSVAPRDLVVTRRYLTSY